MDLPADCSVTQFVPDNIHKDSAEVPLAWFNLIVQRIQAEKLAPPIASRIVGYSGVTLYEAVVPGMPGYQSLAGQLNGLKPLPAAHQKNLYHYPTVANAAMAAILKNLFSNQSAETQKAITDLEQKFYRQCACKVSRNILLRSIERGRMVAAHIARWAASDGMSQYHQCAYTPPVGPGLWVPTLPAFASALEPCWGKMRTFVLPTGSACRATTPYSYSVDPASPFYKDAQEVYDTSLHLTAEQKAIAIFWADNSGETSTPVGHSVSILNQVLVLKHARLDTAAEAYARVGIAVADSFISCWDTKYTYNLVRPVTFIRDRFDPNWLPLLVTPPFPEYTSGHSVQSAAVAQVLTDLFGNVAFTDHTHDAMGLAPRSFATFDAFAQEAAMSRLYAGIHFRNAIQLGLEQGQCVGQKVDRLQFHKP